jgi:hypothetical protein
MQAQKAQSRVAQAVHTFSGQLLGLADRSWQAVKAHSPVTQEVAKDPFTSDAKTQSATAELLIFLLHVCDRISTAAFTAALSEQAAEVLRNAFMGGVVGVTLPTFVRNACPDDDSDELEETQADLLHLYNARATQYGFFSLGGTNAVEQDGLFKLAGIRLAEALDCPDNAEVIVHGVEIIISSVVAVREQLPLKATIGELLAETMNAER